MRILVAGIGNIFLGDDGFGVEVVRRLQDRPFGDDVQVADFGIRSLHLAHELVEGRYDAVILVDAVPRDGVPGTLYAFEPNLDANGGAAPPADGHSLTPAAVLEWVRRAGAQIARVVVVGCEPATIEESMDLSVPVSGSIEGAIAMISDLIAEMREKTSCA